MVEKLDFDKIRPYHDNEVNEAILRLTTVPGFIKTAKFLFPNYPIETVLTKLRQCNSINDFQINFVAPFLNSLIKSSTKSFTYSGVEKLDPRKSYLFISNHRDIILDSAFLNLILYKNGFSTSEIAIGSNLLILPWITDLMKLNRTFIVNRNVSVRQTLEYSTLLSQYIRHNLTERNTSVWIAQREGRTKNGDDRTQPSLLKMLNISGKADFASNFKELTIVPTSISYEYEPCDVAKVAELYSKAHDQSFKKTKVDDLMSMANGLTSPKGNVHFSFNFLPSQKLDEINTIKNKNEQYSLLASAIDEIIHDSFNLNPFNYVALDILENTQNFKAHYTEKDIIEFNEFVEKQLSEIESGDKMVQRKMFIEIYANPVRNKYKIKSK